MSAHASEGHREFLNDRVDEWTGDREVRLNERTNKQGSEQVNEYKEETCSQLLGHNFKVFGTSIKQTPTKNSLKIIIKIWVNWICTNNGSIWEETDYLNMINAFGVLVQKRLKEKGVYQSISSYRHTHPMQTKGGRGFPPLRRYLSPLCLRGEPAAEDRQEALWKRDILRRCKVLALEKWDTSQTKSEKKDIKKKVFPKHRSIENGTLMGSISLLFSLLAHTFTNRVGGSYCRLRTAFSPL